MVTEIKGKININIKCQILSIFSLLSLTVKAAETPEIKGKARAIAKSNHLKEVSAETKLLTQIITPIKVTAKITAPIILEVFEEVTLKLFEKNCGNLC